MIDFILQAYKTNPKGLPWQELQLKIVLKKLTTAAMVFATAFGTALFGVLIDAGFSIEQIAIVSAIYISLSIVLLFIIRKQLKPINI